MGLFENKTYLISGASRGIGKAIALKLASEGANIVIASKSTEENPKLGGTIYSAAEEVIAAGGKALAVPCDIRDEAMITDVVHQAINTFGAIDGLINNASAISLTSTLDTPSKRFDLMFDINVRGTYLLTQHCLPHLLQAEHAHILTLSPPIDLQPKWLGAHPAYTLSKFNMTLLAMAWAEEFKHKNISSNSLWPATTIATAAVNNLLGGDYLMQRSRKPEIVADAVHFLFQQKSKAYTGIQWLDEALLQQAGITDLEHYRVNTAMPLQPDLFL
jgi:citronellol/citronellal dehydrogenase